MKSFVRFLICCCASIAAIYISGFANLTDGISDSLAGSTLIGASLILAAIVFMLWEGYIRFNRKNSELSNKIQELEEEIAKLKETS